MNELQALAMTGMATTLLAAAVCFLLGKAHARERAQQDAAIMDAGYRAALTQTVEALEQWEQTRGGWTDDGTQRIPLATSMKMASALGFGRTALLADSRPHNVEQSGGPQP